MGGNFKPEQVAGLVRNHWQVWAGIRNWTKRDTETGRFIDQKKDGEDVVLTIERLADMKPNDLISQLMKSGQIISFKQSVYQVAENFHGTTIL